MNFDEQQVIEKMAQEIKAREDWEKYRPLREGFQKVILAIGMILFFGWLFISIWLAIGGVKDNACTGAAGDAVYCGE